VNILLQYNFNSIICFKYEKPKKLLDEMNVPKKKDVFVYKPSIAEKTSLEERI
jgi:hypothetical protein